MAAARQNTAKRRAEDRAKRRAEAQSHESSPAQDDGAAGSGDHDVAETLRGAASAALAGAAVGAARAFAQRRSPPEPEVEGEEHPEPEMEGEEQPEPEPEPETDREEPAEEQQPQEHRSQRETRPLQPPLSGGQARDIVQRAREELQELRGADAEAVSSVMRTPDGWRVGLQVVELRRIPASTDVLATYEVELDPDGRLVTFEQTRRYVRSEAER